MSRDGTPREAATVVLLRPRSGGPADGPFEIYLVRRPKRAGFMPDSHVFPGGKIDAADADATLGGDAALTAAAREVFEECGILLAEDAGGRPADTRGEPFLTHRRALLASRTTLATVVSVENLRIAAHRLSRWAHWVTPSGEPVRFSARFFLARLPPGQVTAHAPDELADELWATPAEALERERAGALRLPPPTYFTLHELAQFPTLADVTRAAKVREVVTIMPKFLERDGVTMILLPWDRDYATASGDGLPVSPGFVRPPWSRHVLEGGRWWRRSQA